MIVRVLARGNPERQIVLAHQVVGEADVVEAINFYHQVVDSFLHSADSKRDRVVALVAVHEHRRGDLLAHLKLIFDTAAHPERAVEANGGGDVLLAYDAMAQPTAPGFEASVHPAARMKGFAVLNVRTVKDLDRIAVRIVELQHFE